MALVPGYDMLTSRSHGLDGETGRLARLCRSAESVASEVGTVVSDATRAVFTPAGMVGVAVEALWVGAHVALYPAGLLNRAEQAADLGYGVSSLPPIQRGLVIGDVEAAGTPILLVHGMVDNQSIFGYLRRSLRRRGFGRVVALNYSPLTADVRLAADRLAEEVEFLVAETGYERIHVIGHSLGGLIARYYVTRLGGDERIHTLVTMGTPHQGTYTAYAIPSHLCRQLRPGSDLMSELEAPAPGCRTRFICYWSDLDQMIVPQSNAVLDHSDLSVRNVKMHGLGHMSLPISGRVAHDISTALSHLDQQGGTVTAGVTTLARPGRHGTSAR